MRTPKPPDTIGTTKPRNDFGPREALALAALLQRRSERTRRNRLTAAGRLRMEGRP